MILPQILKNKQTNHTKPKIIKPAQISGFITKKEKKAFPVAPFCHSVLHAACVPFHLSTGFYFPLLRILLVHLSCSLCYEGFILLWVSLLSFSWSQEEHRTTCVVTPTTLDWNPFPIRLLCLVAPHLISTSASSVQELVKRKILP